MDTELTGKICPYCQSPIGENDQTTLCTHCMTPHHSECWSENGGCTTYGCRYAPALPAVAPAGSNNSRSRTITPAAELGGVVCPYCRQATSSSLSNCEHCDGQLYAGFWNRLWAWLFDRIVLGCVNYIFIIIFVILGAITAGIAGDGADSDTFIGTVAVIYIILSLIISWLYYAITESSLWRATPGKILLGIAVTDYEGRKISFGRASARYFASILSYLIVFLGFIAVAFTPRKQALHDTIAHTVVVRSVRPDTAFKDENQIRRLVLGIIISLITILFTLFSVWIFWQIYNSHNFH